MVERASYTRLVVGSIPTSRTEPTTKNRKPAEWRVFCVDVRLERGKRRRSGGNESVVARCDVDAYAIAGFIVAVQFEVHGVRAVALARQ